MTTELGQFAITDVSPGYWRVTFSNPPINLQDPDTILELQELIGLIETEEELKVVVLDSAHPDFFINHYDVSRAAETPGAPGPTGLPTFIDTTTRLAMTSVVSIASIRVAIEAAEPKLLSRVISDLPAARRQSSGNRRWGQECFPEGARSSAAPC